VNRHRLVLALVPALVLAGCLGGLATETGPSDSTEGSPEQVPGVTNGTLSNASALVEADRNAVIGDGAALQINQSSGRINLTARIVVGANFSTYSLSGTGEMRDGQSTTIDQWSNETTQFVRTSSAEQTNYRVVDPDDDRLDILSGVDEFVSAGAFEVSETTDDGTVVLTADRTSAADGSMTDVDSFDGRLVVDESGQIQNLSVAATRGEESVTYHYQLRQSEVKSVPRPDWVDDVPPGATVRAQLSVDVEESSYLALEHTGGDSVPSATSVRVASNGTTDTMSLERPLSSGETRYVYVDASADSLRLTTDRPDESTVSPLTSPVSVRIATDGGAVLHSSSMAWESESAAGGTAGSSSGTTSSESADETAGSTRSNESEQ